MIIKIYKKEGRGFTGQDVGAWTKNWDSVADIIAASKNVEHDRLSCFFRRYFPRPPGRILEGGCGTGKYVIAYRRLGYDIYGVDFCGETIRRIKAQAGAGLPVYEADVTALPFETGYFDCYYSGGVIEHFEDGPGAPLAEARRVLKKGALLLATVPYVNLLRRFRFSLFPGRVEEDFLQLKCASCRRDAPPAPGYRFSEYQFDTASVGPYFKAAGFTIEKVYPTDFLWGELGIPLHGFIKDRKAGREGGFTGAAEPAAATVGKSTAGGRPFIKQLAYDLFVTEDRDNIALRLPLFILNGLGGHMALFVARAV